MSQGKKIEIRCSSPYPSNKEGDFLEIEEDKESGGVFFVSISRYTNVILVSLEDCEKIETLLRECRESAKGLSHDQP